MALLAAGCAPDALLLQLEVSADWQPTSLDVLVRDQEAGVQILAVTGQQVPMRDITAPGQGLKLAVFLSRPGTYLVHIVGRSPGMPQPEVATAFFAVDRDVQAAAHLTSILPGTDVDGDTFPACPPGSTGPAVDCDCDDTSAAVNPAADEICADGTDQNCDGVDPPCADDDHDGVPSNLDCDDHDPNRFPGNPEAPNSCPQYGSLGDPRCGDGIDQDCNGHDEPCVIDEDCDGYAPPPMGNDCDDHDPAVHPGAPELCGNGKDDNCDPAHLVDEGCVPCDADGDGFLRLDPAAGCNPPPGAIDCDDEDAGRNPGVTSDCGGLEGDPRCAGRQLCNGKDDDCDGVIDDGCPPASCDADGDGFQRQGAGCTPAPGTIDCNDNDPHIYPGAPDRCGNGVAENCVADLPCTADADGDGYNAGVDCDDGNPAVHPWATEVCNGRDDDCDGLVDEGNPDAQGRPLAAAPPCFDDIDGVCGPSGATGGTCVCSRAQVAGHRDPDPARRVTCPGEDLAANASPRCFGAPQPLFEQCNGLDDDCDGLIDVGAPCPGGQECVGAMCICDGASCAGGCCDSQGNCISPPTDSACGLGGAACDLCRGSHHCDAGTCR